jgi:hypothetical protein
VFAQAEAAGHVAVLDHFGVTFINDTCWCMLTESVTLLCPVSCLPTSAHAASPHHLAVRFFHCGRVVRVGGNGGFARSDSAAVSYGTRCKRRATRVDGAPFA